MHRIKRNYDSTKPSAVISAPYHEIMGILKVQFEKVCLKNFRKMTLSILLILIIGFLSANVVYAVELTTTLPVRAGTMATDSGTGEIFVTTIVTYVNQIGMKVDNLNNSVSVISDSDNSVVATVTVGDGPTALVYDSEKGEIFVANQASGTVSVISDSNYTVAATIDLKTDLNYHGPTALAYDSGKGEIFACDQSSGIISVISDNTNKVIATLPLGINPGPSELIYDSGKDEILVIYADSKNLSTSNFIKVISDSTNKVIATVPLNNFPSPYAAYDYGKGEIFVSNPFDDTISVISDSNYTVVATIPVGNAPVGLAYDSSTGTIFVANSADNTVSVISDSTNTVLGTVPVGNRPVQLVHDSGKGEIFIRNSDSISVLSVSSLPFVSPLPTTSMSPTPTVPEFSVQVLILVIALTLQ